RLRHHVHLRLERLRRGGQPARDGRRCRPRADPHRAVRADRLSTASAAAATFRDKTAWARNLAAPVRDYLSNETGGAVALLGATIVALVWANASVRSYESFWTTSLSINVGDS